MSSALAWDLFSHFLLLSLLAVGGAITTSTEMHRYMVLERGWMTDTQFSASIALAQGAPGPNVLFVAVLGWQAGANLGAPLYQWWAGLAGMTLAMLGIMIPSTVLTLSITRWLDRHQSHFGVRAFKMGLAPVAVGLLFATAWILARTSAQQHQGSDTVLWLFVFASAVIIYFTRLHLLWVLGLGAVAGFANWI